MTGLGSKKLVSTFLTLSILAGSGYAYSIPKPVEAQVELGLGAIFGVSSIVSVPIESKVQGTKEAFFDGIAIMIGSAIISTMIRSVTNWVNSGFEGKPAFAQDLRKTANDLEGEVVSRVLNEIENEIGTNIDLDGFFCGPFDRELRDALRIQLAIKTGRPPYTQYSKCTVDSILEKAGNTLEDFEDDFSKGGWPAWLELTEPKNNRWGAWGTLQTEIWQREDTAKSDKEKELSFGGGFLSQFKPGECNPPGPPYRADYQWPINEKTGKPDCPKEYKKTPDQWVTPGKVIEGQFNNIFGGGFEKLQLADEFDELVSALLNQIVLKVLQGVGGLIGAGEAEPGETSLLDQLGDESDRLTQESEATQTEQEEIEAEAVERAEAQALCSEYYAEMQTLTYNIPAKQTQVTKCFADVAAMEVRISGSVESESDSGDTGSDGSASASVSTNQADIDAKNAAQALCDAKSDELKLMQDRMAELNELTKACVIKPGDPAPLCTDGHFNDDAPLGRRITLTHAYFKSTAGAPALDLNIPAAGGTSYRRITVEFDVTVGPWNSECPSSFNGACYHQLFWMMRDREWCPNNVVAVQFVGPSRQKVKMESLINGDQKDSAGMNFYRGQTYHIKYNYGFSRFVPRQELFVDGNRVLELKAAPKVDFKGSSFIQFGGTDGVGPEVDTIDWEFKNIRVELDPDSGDVF
jgi:hypothetical protein